MKLALLSDIHANLPAWEACVARARALGAQRWAILGDLVGYGASPGEVVDQVMTLAEQEGAIVLRGNHDAMAINPLNAGKTLGAVTAAWTHNQLSPLQRAYLARLPLTWQAGSLLLAHASADAPERWHYVSDERAAAASLDAAAAWPEVRHVFVGHVHEQTLYYRGAGRGLMSFAPTAGVQVPTPGHRHWLATIGSVGQPRDGDPRAMFAMFDTELQQLTFHRVAYDHHAAAAAILRAGLPEFFANRLGDGR